MSSRTGSRSRVDEGGINLRDLFGTAALWLVLVTITLAVPEQVLASGRCTSIKLEKNPIWMSSATWSPDGRSLLVVDAIGEEILVFDTAGHLTRTIENLALDGLARPRFLPSILVQHGDGYLLEVEDALLLELDSEFQVLASHDLSTLSKDARYAIGGLYGWTTAGEDILAYADLRDQAGNWSSSIVRFPLREPTELKQLAPIPLDSETRNFYLFGFHYLSGMEKTGNGYFVLMDSPPRVEESEREDGVRDLDAIPAASRIRPKLPENRGIESVKAMYQAFARSSMPAGIYAWKGSVYLLTRQEVGNMAVWHLSRIDPTLGKVTETRRLPVSSPHVYIAPGEKYWAIFEKGPVEELGSQEIGGVTLIPAEVVEHGGKASFLSCGAGGG